jgi:capsular polysaccharide biosynthesis protein
MNEQQNLISATKTIIRWWKHIIGISILAAIVTAIVALFVLDEYYLSTSNFYPLNQSVNDRSVLFNTSSSQIVNYYGDKYDVNRVLTIANSKPLVMEMIEKFGIVEHYKIDRNKPYWRTKVYKKFLKNYNAIKTEKDAIEISLLDTKPELAAKFVNEMVDVIDSINSKTIKESRARMVIALNKDLNESKERLHELSLEADSFVRKGNLKITFSQYGELLVDGDNFLARERVRQLFKEIANEQRELLNKTNIREQLEVSINNTASSLSIVEKAESADRREKPQRTIMVIIAFFIALVFSIIGVLLLEQLNDFRKQLNA